ncbi:alpha/beta fold hydrolase [Rheinheimera maricola]|uniref:Alpha/beta hydrolase n=1 Tax=Rheinheimera maricola TaxID=2793282 RepID=A0ABS7X7D5_9GAMM|nr:alpha/beta hydrolase [Rheinheimera maricola]MBZ9611446.1 alpha/beta hydrolase [Rheinheimera maricola]
MNTLKLKHLSAAWPLIAATALLMPLAASAQQPKLVTPQQAKPTLSPCYAQNLTDRMLCGSIRRPLDAAAPSQDAGIDIHFAVLPAINPLHQQEAVVAFAGGPGQSAFDAAATFAHILRYARESRDILLVDQRGTGKSGLLQCDGLDLTSQFALDENSVDITKMTRKETELCRDKLQVDLNHYTTVAAAGDFEAVRLALGYQKLHLYGGSYGTRMAQEYMRQYPSAVLTATLDGVVPFNQSFGAMGAASDASLEAVYAYCDASPECQQQFPAARAQLQQLQQTLTAQTINTKVRHPRTFELIELNLTRAKLQQALRFALYRNSTRAMLPLVVDQASTGDYSALTGLMLAQDIAADLSVGVNFAVVCGEDRPFWTAQSQAEFAQSYLGQSWLQGAETSCNVWQVTPVAADYTAPLQTDTPVLLLSGGLDPVTPPGWAELAMAKMRNARHLVAPHATHIVASQTCAPKLISQFINQQSTAELDERCLQQELRQAFLTNANGTAMPPTALAASPTSTTIGAEE